MVLHHWTRIFVHSNRLARWWYHAVALRAARGMRAMRWSVLDRVKQIGDQQGLIKNWRESDLRCFVNDAVRDYDDLGLL
jgi:hypothetical protein